MVKEDMLDVEQLRGQCTSMIEKLEAKNQTLNSCGQRITEVISAQQLSGAAYSELKNKFTDMNYIVSALRIANSYQVNDCKQLMNLIGDEKLDGNFIFDTMAQLDKLKKNASDEAAEYARSAQKAKTQEEIDHYTSLAKEKTEDAARFDALHRIMERKVQKFDNIVAATNGLFRNVSHLESIINNGIASISGKGLDNKAVKEWKKNLADVMEQSRKKSIIEVALPKVIDDDGNEWIGGNQFWLYDGTKLSVLKAFHGCGFIALMNVQLALEGVTEITQQEYMARMNQFFHDHKKLKKIIKKYGATIPCAIMKDFEGKDLETLLKEITQDLGYKEASWGKQKGMNIDDIRDQLAHNIPVIYSIGDRMENTEMLKFYTKNEDGTFQVAEKITISGVEKKNMHEMERKGQAAFEFDKENPDDFPIDTRAHAVTITGMEEFANMQSGNLDYMLRISSWGREYYVSFDEMQNYIDTSLAGASEESRRNMAATGNNNVSHIQHK